jgi:dynein heavy chain
MRERHWKTISDNLNLPVQPSPEFTLTKALDMGLLHHIDIIQEVSELASKEFGIEMALKKMQQEWIPLEMQISPYKETGTYIMKIEESYLQ